MHRAVIIGVICILVLAVPGAEGQELSTDVFPSEDELLEALIAGEIDYDQYLLLLDLAQHGVDSTNAHLLDLVPNLSSLRDRAASSALESEQQELFVAANTARRSRIRYSYYRTVDTEEKTRYRIDTRVQVTENWNASVAVRRELSGRERFVSRAIRYHNSEHVFRELIIGSNSERYGLGAVIGYRGKLLRYSDKLDDESFLYPDYSGFNGVAIILRERSWQLRSMVSQLRDSAAELRTVAGTVERATGLIRPFVVAGATRARNRESGGAFDDLKLSGGLLHKHKRGSVSLEYCRQIDTDRDAGVLIAEGTYRLPRNRIEFAGWQYDNDYIDLTGGGRAVDIRVETELEGPAFAFRSKRPGQHGVLFKGTTELGSRMQLYSAFVYARRNTDTTNLQWLEGVERELTPQISVRLDYLHNFRERNEDDGANDRFTRRCRAEARVKADRWRGRSYIAFSSTSSYGDYVSLFVNTRFDINLTTTAEVWSNLSRLAKGTVQYWYLYGKLSQQLTATYELGVKLMHRFDRRASLQHSNAVTLELEATW